MIELDKKNFIIEKYRSGKICRKKMPYKSINGFPKYLGYEYYEDGSIKYEGVLQRGGLYEGKYYYPSGKLKFVGRYNEREKGGYYGPPYPVYGEYYAETGKLLYKGRFETRSVGSLGYPVVIKPEGFGI